MKCKIKLKRNTKKLYKNTFIRREVQQNKENKILFFEL